MLLPAPLTRLFELPVADLLREMPDAASQYWEMDASRQKKHEVHRHTRSIVFEELRNGWVPGEAPVIERRSYAPPALTELAYCAARRIAEHYSGTVVRLLLAELAPRGIITTHRDHGAGLTEVHRCHLPIVTNSEVKFFIDLIPHVLEAGTVYEFDNTRRHSVENQSDERRIHLLCDVMPAALARQ